MLELGLRVGGPIQLFCQVPKAEPADFAALTDRPGRPAQNSMVIPPAKGHTPAGPARYRRRAHRRARGGLTETEPLPAPLRGVCPGQARPGRPRRFRPHGPRAAGEAVPLPAGTAGPCRPKRRAPGAGVSPARRTPPGSSTASQPPRPAEGSPPGPRVRCGISTARAALSARRARVPGIRPGAC
jgi:hypothetical protein